MLIVRDHERKCNVCLSIQNSSKQLPNYVITSKQLKRDARKGRPVYLVEMHHVRTVVSWMTVHSLHFMTVQPGTLPDCFPGLSLSLPCYFSCVDLVVYST
jgi:hypothetical protein